ncbi:hypothetical protein HMPREF9946_01021, partial [Acetobacteraceae bacterium AT-5844]
MLAKAGFSEEEFRQLQPGGARSAAAPGIEAQEAHARLGGAAIHNRRTRRGALLLHTLHRRLA